LVVKINDPAQAQKHRNVPCAIAGAIWEENKRFIGGRSDNVGGRGAVLHRQHSIHGSKRKGP
jgi:hypothetical protein